nr:MAG TPA: hypothetical protein [Bacteriophage sp.]
MLNGTIFIASLNHLLDPLYAPDFTVSVGL